MASFGIQKIFAYLDACGVFHRIMLSTHLHSPPNTPIIHRHPDDLEVPFTQALWSLLYCTFDVIHCTGRPRPSHPCTPHFDMLINHDVRQGGSTSIRSKLPTYISPCSIFEYSPKKYIATAKPMRTTSSIIKMTIFLVVLHPFFSVNVTLCGKSCM